MAMDCYPPPSPDHTCDIWQAGDSIVPADAIPPGDSRPYFCIKVEATFTTYSESEEGDANVVESAERVKTFVVPLEQLVGSDASWPTISNMLSAVNVPIGVQPCMIHEIDEYLRSVARERHNTGVKVLPTIVSIRVEDYVEDNGDDDNENDGDGGDDVVLRESMNEAAVAHVPASRAAVRGLEAVEGLDGGLTNAKCAICQEEIVVGSDDIKRMPCNHVSHGGCIVRWLGVSCFCPLCRFQLPMS
ncbi:hypothetical protein Acr_00g0028910 [Actinidia rufa]|uniref:RING-type E3 ubiquitin transferase n=1 Tax=Actinidia rufa TaxID=165716 RepID=A0A7J0DEF3_9ERIC|nr:hypothetical protein Acr_00g0028910 [Actinidia rufa]